jgi:hypothetical protein
MGLVVRFEEEETYRRRTSERNDGEDFPGRRRWSVNRAWNRAWNRACRDDCWCDGGGESRLRRLRILGTSPLLCDLRLMYR